MKKSTRRIITQTSRWSIFVMTALTLGMSIVEASANETYKLILANPELAQYTTLAKSGYFFFM